tara:strand:- start:116 stop:574 length:459 start_codon:yes stop_codon:yes gene_type:complete
MSAFLKWWLLITLTVVGLSIAAYFNFIQFLYAHDLTKLSVAILALFAATSSVIGYKLWKERDVKKKKYGYDVEWFVSEMMISLGMIGTVIGFIYMLYSVFSSLNIADTLAVQQSLGKMAQGMGTALLTTLVGLVSSVLIKSQLVMVENERKV